MASLAAVVFALSPAAWAALLLVAALAYALWRIRAPYLPDLPTPPRWPWFGHVLEFNKAVGQLYEINRCLAAPRRRRRAPPRGPADVRRSFYHNQWRRPFYVALPGVQPIIQLVTPEQHEWFFKTNFDNYVKGAWPRAPPRRACVGRLRADAHRRVRRRAGERLLWRGGGRGHFQ
jgi:hypothetical protein